MSGGATNSTGEGEPFVAGEAPDGVRRREGGGQGRLAGTARVTQHHASGSQQPSAPWLASPQDGGPGDKPPILPAASGRLWVSAVRLHSDITPASCLLAVGVLG